MRLRCGADLNNDWSAKYEGLTGLDVLIVLRIVKVAQRAVLRFDAYDLKRTDAHCAEYRRCIRHSLYC